MCPQGNPLCENETCTCDPCECGQKTGNDPHNDIQEQCTE